MNPVMSPLFRWRENKHTDSILDTTLVPARISKRTEGMARKIAERTVDVLKGSGIFCVEMFLNSNERDPD